MKILAVSPHLDDETLGAGGTLLKYQKRGDEIFWLNFTDMEEKYGYSKENIEEMKKTTDKVKKEYGFDGFINLKLKPAGLEEYPRRMMIEIATKEIRKIKPDVVLLPFHNDPHSDHRTVFEVVYSGIKIFRIPSIKRILMMEIISETDFASSNQGFVPNYYVDISGTFEKKIKITRMYRSEIEAHPFPRSVKHLRALAISRGAQSGCKYAEAFLLLKNVEQ